MSSVGTELKRILFDRFRHPLPWSFMVVNQTLFHVMWYLTTFVSSVANLEINKPLLTGEALPLAKTTDTLASRPGPDGDLIPIGVGNRINLAYASTNVGKGHGSGIVVATGMGTQVGTIASATNKKRKQGKNDDGPLQVKYVQVDSPYSITY